MDSINWTYLLGGAALGYFGSSFLKLSPTVGAAIGAAGGFFAGGGTLASLTGSGGTTVTPTMTIKSG